MQLLYGAVAAAATATAVLSLGLGVDGSVVDPQRLHDAVLLGTSSAVASVSSTDTSSAISDSNSGSSGAASSTSENDTSPFRSIAPIGDWTIVQPDCGSSSVWRRPLSQHLYFQLGNACFLIAFLAAHGAAGQLWLRCWLCCGCVLLMLWGWLVECSSDAMLWNCVFLTVNAGYGLVLLIRLRPVRFDKEVEAVYAALFRPLRVTRLQFGKVLGCMRVVRALKYQEVYAQEKVTKVDSLSLVLSGK